MKLRDLGADATRDWFQQILEWSRKKITFADNIDGVFITVRLETTEIEVGHNLGRVPQYVFEVASYGAPTVGITLTKQPEAERIFIKRASQGTSTLFLT